MMLVPESRPCALGREISHIPRTFPSVTPSLLFQLKPILETRLLYVPLSSFLLPTAFTVKPQLGTCRRKQEFLMMTAQAAGMVVKKVQKMG